MLGDSFTFARIASVIASRRTLIARSFSTPSRSQRRLLGAREKSDFKDSLRRRGNSALGMDTKVFGTLHARAASSPTSPACCSS